MNSRNFFAELKRRNVYKVAVAYAVVAWLLMQIATQIFPFFEIPNWIVRLVVLLILIGFPLALAIAWAFELTPEGIRRTETAGSEAGRPRNHTWIYVVAVAAVLSISLFFLGRFTARTVGAAAGRAEKSIAVLSFENLSDDPDNAYFTDGIQDEILARLAKVADLKVISRTSTQRFKSAPGDLRQIAQQLDVAHGERLRWLRTRCSRLFRRGKAEAALDAESAAYREEIRGTWRLPELADLWRGDPRFEKIVASLAPK